MQCPQYVYIRYPSAMAAGGTNATYQRVARMTNDKKFRNASLDFMLVKAVAECPELALLGLGATSDLSPQSA
jgi:hypothetical protein